MKKIFLTIAIFLSGIFTTNAQQETFDLTVNISGLSSNNGKILIGIYNSEANFLKKRLKGDSLKIQENMASVTFKDLPKGEYAVSYIHDENNNKKMDTNFIGIPSEDYGCSNNATGFMGPPKYEDAKFLLDKKMTIKIGK